MSEPDLAARERFQSLLRDLFQIRDAAELDFGIYRIMGQKRTVIEEFIDRELLAEIDAALKTGPLRQESQAAIQLGELAAQIRETLADDAIDADGRLHPAFEKTKLGKDYLAAQKRTVGAKSATEHEASIYNHLHQFFSRYYDKGDFLSLRRYSKREKYAIPYNGEEVHLHWANADQYYVKTGETFTDYRWKDPSGAVRVRFTVTRADLPKDNIKSPDTRYFLPRLDEVAVETVGTGPKDPERHLLLTLPFHYRGLTEAEAKHLETIAADRGLTGGNGSGGKLQAAALAEAVDYFGVRRPDAALGSGGPTPRGGNPEGSASNRETKSPRGSGVDPANNSGVEPPHSTVLAALLAEHHRDAEGAPVSRLAHHLRRFTVKNTSDYFIHKDLGGFLARELDFYLKNEVLHLDTLEAGGEERAEGWFETLRVMRRIGGTIIRFLAQIENFQKRIFEKKKFVTECHWCLTLDRVPEELYPEIAKNAAQIAEWKKLFAIEEAEGWSEPPTARFMKENWNLVLDTRFFGEGFVDRVLESIGDLAEQSGGTALWSENFQGLRLLEESFRGGVPCVFIDPPYNTEGDGFLYKDQYKSSSWLSMIGQGIDAARGLMSGNGSLTMSLDEGEQEKAKALLKSVFGDQNFISSVIWQKKYAPANDAKWFSEDHDYLLVAARDRESWYPKGLARTEKQDRMYKNPDNDPRGPWKTGDYTSNKSRQERPNCWYSITQPNLKEEIWPSEDRAWAYSPEMHERNVRENRIWWGKDGTNRVPAYKRFLSDVGELRPRTIWKHDEVGHNQDGVRQNQELFGLKSFASPKPVQLIDRVVSLNEEGVVLDFFAGSGTTGDTVLRKNRTSASGHRFLLVEVGEHFRTVLLPRLQKIIYSADWSEGKPQTRNTGLSHCFQYLSLESYEDALGNIAFDRNEIAQRQLRFDEYVIHYMLAFETGGSETLLDTDRLVAPFDYKLEIRDGDETVVKPVDLPETFNFLLGLRVRTRRVLHRDGIHRGVKRGKKTGPLRYLVLRGRTNPHATGGEREVVVIWRTTAGWEQADYQADRAFIDEHGLCEGADEVFVNDQSLLRHPNAKSLDPVFKRRMFNEE